MPKSKRLIIFFIPSEKLVNGGILSLFSIAKVSREFRDVHNADVVISMYPGVKSYGHNDLFENDETIYEFDDLMEKGPYEFLQLMVPEVSSYNLTQSLKKYADVLASIPDLRVNILNQNILLMQPPQEVANWFAYTPSVTMTIAHNKYAKQELADKYCLPTRHLSTFVDPHQYNWVDFEKKADLILLSNDVTDIKDKIVKSIKQHLPKYKVVLIDKMPYETYKKLMSQAKFTLTFGEGFDGYYVEGFFTGGITFAVYNDDFFPDKDFASFGNTYKNYNDMLQNIVPDIRKLEKDKKTYEKIVKQNFDKIAALYSFDYYKSNVKKLYLEDFTFMPSKDSPKKLIREVVLDRDKALANKDSIISDRDKTIKDMEKMIADKTAEIHALANKVTSMENSKSWKVTKPLRKATSIIKKQ